MAPMTRSRVSLSLFATTRTAPSVNELMACRSATRLWRGAPPETPWSVYSAKPGPIPPPSEAEAQTFQNHSMPLWEASLVWPYRLVTFPLLALSAGVGECVIFFEDQNVIYHIQRLMAPRQLPYGFRVNLTAGGLPGFGGGVTFFHNNALGTDNTFEL